jgi:hypothetical protein
MKLMKKVFVMCLVLTCLCLAASVLADNGTVANAPKNATAPGIAGAARSDNPVKQHSLDMDYVQAQKLHGTLKMDDPAYLRLLAETPAPSGGGSLDQGNDNCPATVIAALPYTDSGTTAGLANDFTCAGNTAGDAVYEYTAVVAGLHSVRLCGSAYDTRLEVRTGACPGVAYLCNDDFCGLQSGIDVTLNVGDVITIVVDGFTTNTGAYTLNVTGPQPPPVCTPDFIFTAPFSNSSNTCGAGDDCALVAAEDHIYQVTIPTNGQWQFSLCDNSVAFWDSYLLIGTTCCSSDVWGQDDGCSGVNYYLSQTPCLTLTAGTYFVDVEGLYSGQCGGYTLSVTQCAPPVLGRCCYGAGQCADVTQTDCNNLGGQWDVNLTCSTPCPPPPGALRVITVPVPSPSGVGVSVAANCRGELFYTNYGSPDLYKIDAFGNLLADIPTTEASGLGPISMDEMSWDEGRQMLWGASSTFTYNGIYLIDPVTGVCTFQFSGMGGLSLTDGLAFDSHDGTIWHSSDVSSAVAHFTDTGLLLGNVTFYDAAGNVDGSISGVCVGTGNTIYLGHNGQGRIARYDKTTGAWISEFFSPGGRDEGLECDAINFAPDLALWSKDAYNNTITAIQVENGTCACAQLPDTCLFPYEEIDDGDLAACNYPTLHANPGHGLSGIAWLGAGITGEPVPNSLNVDPMDDGVVFVGLPWMPCTPQVVAVTVTPGPNYPRYQECGGHLYLNAWKDGNLDGDFCDELCGPPPLPTASEWIIQDVLVGPGTGAYTFIDPGVFDLGVYDGVFRFRLTSQPVGRFGFGQNVAGACNFTCPGTFGLDFLGEVEDYIIPDAQLAVNLSSFTAIGSANAITLHWTTASERNNDHFELMRNGALVHSQVSSGNSASGSTYEWVDGSVEMGRTYTYTLAAVDANGQRDELGTVESSPNANAVVVTEYALHQNFPNPFNPSTTITFDLVESGNVTLQVFNLMGQEVATLVNGNLSSGRHTLNFSAAGLPSGLYLYKLEANGFSAQKKMLLMK